MTLGALIGDLIPLAVGVAVSPVPIIAVILMLLSPRARVSAVGFGAGWVLGIGGSVVVFSLLAGGVGAKDGEPSTTVAVVTLLLGVALLLVGIRQWRTHGEAHAKPAWMASIDGMGAGKAFGIAAVLAAVNPKNLMLNLAAGVAIGSAGLAAGQATIAGAVFVVLAAVTVLAPVIGYLVAEARLRAPLAELKTWLEENNQAVMSVLMLVLGVVLIGKGIGGF